MEPKICSRCGSDYKVEIHHIVFRSWGGSSLPDNLEPLCQGCHDYQHAKEQIINNIIGYLDQIKRLVDDKRKDFLTRKIGINFYRLEILENNNSVLFIKQRGYFKYWDDESTHDEKSVYKLIRTVE
jgi:hypothetical protein